MSHVRIVKENYHDVVSIGCIIVFAVKLTKMTSRSQAIIWLWTQYVLTIVLSSTDLEIVSIISILFCGSASWSWASGSSQSFRSLELCVDNLYGTFSSFSLFCVFSVSRVVGAWHALLCSSSYFAGLLLLFRTVLEARLSVTHFFLWLSLRLLFAQSPNFTGCFSWNYTCLLYWFPRSSWTNVFDCIANCPG